MSNMSVSAELGLLQILLGLVQEQKLALAEESYERFEELAADRQVITMALLSLEPIPAHRGIVVRFLEDINAVDWQNEAILRERMAAVERELTLVRRGRSLLGRYRPPSDLDSSSMLDTSI